MTRRGHVNFSDRPDYDCYLNAIRDDDFFIHELIRQYEDLGLLKNTLFVILADHGEAFGEHGRRTHNDIPWQEGLHVPALIYDPNGVSPAPGHVAANTSQIDLAPTVAELLGFQVKSGHFQGRSLLSPQPPFRIIHSACYGEESCLASLQGDLKFIDHEGRRPDELFNLRLDPQEQDNLPPRSRRSSPSASSRCGPGTSRCGPTTPGSRSTATSRSPIAEPADTKRGTRAWNRRGDARGQARRGRRGAFDDPIGAAGLGPARVRARGLHLEEPDAGA